MQASAVQAYSKYQAPQFTTSALFHTEGTQELSVLWVHNNT